MPIDLDMLLSASPPLYAYSAFADNRCTSPFDFTKDFHQNNNYAANYPVRKKNYLNRKDFHQHLHYSELFPSVKSYSINSLKNKKCDIIEDDTLKVISKGVKDQRDNCQGHHQLEDNKNREKKRVSFADDKGLALVEIRPIPETSEYVPNWAEDFLSMLTAGVKSTETCVKQWKPQFSNPPYTPLAMRERLENHLVALESVVFDEVEENSFSGTIKVRNTAFEKEVFVRITFDRWVSFTDIPAIYIPPTSDSVDSDNSSSCDTFRFSTTIPQSALRYEVVEFCVCYRDKDQEYWDNNGGINYRLIATESKKKVKTAKCTSQVTDNKPGLLEPQYTLSVTTSFNECPEIAAWNHFMI